MSNSNSSSGIGVLGLLGVTFVALKLTGIIDWSWWFVTLPFLGRICASYHNLDGRSRVRYHERFMAMIHTTILKIREVRN